MGRIIDVIMYCSTSKKRYKGYFEENEPETWFGVRVEPYQESFLDKVKAALSGGGTTPSRGAMSAERRQRQASVTGIFNIGEHKCPYCGNESFVKCGSCGEWSCHKYEDNRFTCGSCNATGVIEGYIDSATGNMNDDSPCSPSTLNNGNGTSPRRTLK